MMPGGERQKRRKEEMKPEKEMRKEDIKYCSRSTWTNHEVSCPPQ
jgi:hypothetical protein